MARAPSSPPSDGFEPPSRPTRGVDHLGDAERATGQRTTLPRVDEAENERCCFDDWVDHWATRARKKDTVAGVTAPLLDALQEAGIRDRTVLDLGCGIGDLSIEAVRAGASSARGYDLSPRAVAAARALAADRGVAERTSFEVGDGARIDLPPADVVVLNRVFCCYPDVRSLLERSLAAAGSVYAFTIPRSTGVAGLISRVQTRLANAWYRLRASKFGDFRVYVHDIDVIDARARADGFRALRREHRRFAWDLAVYGRDARPDYRGARTNDQKLVTGSKPSRR
jgi:SAM-dependent methyltransferase